jgi:RNA polymerase sigma factor (sigma-70 family)
MVSRNEKYEGLEELGAAIRAGNGEAFNCFCKRFCNSLQRYFLLRHVQPRDVEDLVQESLMLLWIKREKIRKGRLRAFAFGIANILFLEYKRKNVRLTPLNGATEECKGADTLATKCISPDQAAIEVEETQMARKAIDHLPERQKQVIELIYLKSYSRKEVAREMSISENAVYVFERRALKRLGALMRSGPVSNQPAL